ncbi:MAG: SDR family oxidoreductase [Clostridia bacterium]|nr:SDR family oxidoreductase [Clostridia bacterium]
MTEHALVTGCTSGIGQEIAARLLARGYQVWGVGRDFSREGTKKLLESPAFHSFQCDLTEDGEIDRLVRKVKEATGGDVHLLIHNAGEAWYGMHETISEDAIRKMVRIHVEVPMILTGKLLRAMRNTKGQIIFISSVTATHPSPHGAVYGSCKAAMRSFAASLFEENRKTGLRVTTIMPDMTRTELYRHADFEADAEEDCSLTPEDVAEAVENVLDLRDGMVLTEMILRPQRMRIRKKV